LESSTRRKSLGQSTLRLGLHFFFFSLSLVLRGTRSSLSLLLLKSVRRASTLHNGSAHRPRAPSPRQSRGRAAPAPSPQAAAVTARSKPCRRHGAPEINDCSPVTFLPAPHPLPSCDPSAALPSAAPLPAPQIHHLRSRARAPPTTPRRIDPRPRPSPCEGRIRVRRRAPAPKPVHRRLLPAYPAVAPVPFPNAETPRDARQQRRPPSPSESLRHHVCG
jgi:serralysin